MLDAEIVPVTWSEIVGQKPVVKALKRILDRRDIIKLPGLIILEGARGVGKTSIARLVATHIHCVSRTEDGPCGKCVNCTAIQNNSYKAVAEVNGSFFTSSQSVEDLLPLIDYPSSQTPVVILDAPELVSEQAANALLKAIERRVDRTIFVFTTTQISRISDVLQSRAMTFTLTRIEPKLMIPYLEGVLYERSIPYDIESVRAVTRDSDGSLRRALIIIDQLSSGHDSVTVKAREEAELGTLDHLYGALVDSLYTFDMREIDKAITCVLQYSATPLIVVEQWINFELSVLRGDIKAAFEYPHSEEDKLTRIELLWFLLDKIKGLGVDTKTLLRMGAVLMSARLTRRILDESEAFALLGV